MAYLGRGWLSLAYFVAGLVVSIGEVILFGYDRPIPTYLSLALFNVVGAVHGYVAGEGGNGGPYPFYGRWYGLLTLFVAAPLILTTLFKGFVYQPFTIPTNSNAPTLRSKDYVIASKAAYGYGPYSFAFDMGPQTLLFQRTPQRGDMVIFRVPDSSGNDYVKRVIGLAGDNVQMQHGRLFLNGQMSSRERVGKTKIDDEEFTTYRETLPSGRYYQIMETSDSSQNDNTTELIVPEGHVFVIGDNRDQSVDSRHDAVGYVPIENVFARADFFYSHDDNSWRRVK
jgi:signal peptidase I